MAMPDPFGGMPPELGVEYQTEMRRRQLMEAMLGQAMQGTPAPTNKGRLESRRSPLEPLAQVVQAYFGAKGLQDSDARVGDIGKRYNEGLATEVANYNKARAGSPEIPVPPDELGGGPGREAIAGDPRKAIQQALMSRYPQVQQLGKMEYDRSKPVVVGRSLIDPTNPGKPMAVDQTWQAEQQAALEEKKALREQRMQELQVRLADAKTSREERAQLQRELAEMRIDAAREMKAMAGALRPEPAVTPVTIQDPNNPNATVIIDGRTGRTLGAGPKLTEAGKGNMAQARTMEGLGADLRQAEDLLTGQKRDSEGNVTSGNLPTGSGAGALVDAAAGLIGVTPRGASEADALKVVAGKLVQKVPRFEGPQSDKDVALYKQMAADAGNSAIPRERRLAAVRKMRELYSGYENGSRGRVVTEQITGRPAAPAAGGGVMRFDAQGNPIP